jgi:phosphatidylserine/phosphatidylglycerophosphate/cardiolipin synthase-like enzyme
MDAWLHGRRVEEAAAGVGKKWTDELEANAHLHGSLDKLSANAVRAETRILDSQTRLGSPDDPITEGLRRLVRSARKEIFAQTPYVVLSEEGVRVLEDAARRGVAITILTNSPVSSDNALSQAFFLEQWPEILARVPTLRLYVSGREHNLHAKAVTFDGEVALVGTYNLDPLSMAFNSEVMAATWSNDVARITDLDARRAIERGAPDILEYRIVRNPDGSAAHDDNGAVRVAFGPRDHCTPEQWLALAAYWGALRASKEFVGFSPLL